MHAMRRVVWFAFIGGPFVLACTSETVDPRPPTVTRLSASLNPYNSLSTLVTFDAHDADSARIKYWVPGQAPDATPFQSVRAGLDTIRTLGLRSGTTYYHTVELIGSHGTTHSDTLQYTTGAVPQDLQDARLAITGTPGPEYTLTAFYAGTTAYVVAFDSTGGIRWYRGFPDGVGPVESKQQRNGMFTVFLGQSNGFNPTYGRYVEFRPTGEVVQDWFAGQPYYTDPHELLLTARDGHPDGAQLLGYDTRLVDLSPYGGSINARVAGHALINHSPSGAPVFIWSAWDHFTLDDCINPPAGQVANLDFDHPNSLDFDLDGNYIASFYRFNAVVKIDAQRGDVLWQLGGLRSQFTILNDPLGGFGAQHHAQIMDNGNLLLYDNGQYHTPPESRAVEYAMDTRNKTATLVWEYRHLPAIFTPIVGSVQRLANGNTLVGFGQVGHVTEVSPGGDVVWEGDVKVNGSNYGVYRVIKIASLYQYGRP